VSVIVEKINDERFQRMFEDHQATMLVIDPATGRILDANLAAQEFYGFSSSELKAMSIAEINILTPDEVNKEMKLAVLLDT
jgi:diguanylate cyclase